MENDVTHNKLYLIKKPFAQKKKKKQNSVSHLDVARLNRVAGRQC